MEDIKNIIEFLSECPELSELMSFAAVEEVGKSVIYGVGASPRRTRRAVHDVTGAVCVTVTDAAEWYKDFQINLFQPYDPNDDAPPSVNQNVLSYEQAQNVIDWINAKEDAEDYPVIPDRTVSGMETVPDVPQTAYVNDAEQVIAYYVTLRVYFVQHKRVKYRDY